MIIQLNNSQRDKLCIDYYFKSMLNKGINKKRNSLRYHRQRYLKIIILILPSGQVHCGNERAFKPIPRFPLQLKHVVDVALQVTH